MRTSHAEFREQMRSDEEVARALHAHINVGGARAAAGPDDDDDDDAGAARRPRSAMSAFKRHI